MVVIGEPPEYLITRPLSPRSSVLVQAPLLPASESEAMTLATGLLFAMCSVALAPIVKFPAPFVPLRRKPTVELPELIARDALLLIVTPTELPPLLKGSFGPLPCATTEPARMFSAAFGEILERRLVSRISAPVPAL